MVLLGWYVNYAEPTPKPSYNWLAYHSYGYAWIASNFDGLLRNIGANENYEAYYNGLYAPDQQGWKNCQAAFADLAETCRNRHLPLHILLIPELHSLSGSYLFKPIHNVVRQLAAKNNLDVVDLIEAFPSRGNPKAYWVSPEDAHPNSKANALMAARIEDEMRDHE